MEKLISTIVWIYTRFHKSIAEYRWTGFGGYWIGFGKIRETENYEDSKRN